MTIYDYKVEDNEGKLIDLSIYHGKLVLIVNTATKCGFTPQYQELEALYQKYKDQGFEILDFPSNQFFNQAPGTDLEIQNFCTLNYNTTFKRFHKINVNGRDEIPLYTMLKKAIEGSTKRIKWNFTKFLINREGIPVMRFEPSQSPKSFEEEIIKYL